MMMSVGRYGVGSGVGRGGVTVSISHGKGHWIRTGCFCELRTRRCGASVYSWGLKACCVATQRSKACEWLRGVRQMTPYDIGSSRISASWSSQAAIWVATLLHIRMCRGTNELMYVMCTCVRQQ